jgi:hypothetical protein
VELVGFRRALLQDHLTLAQDNKGYISLDGGNDIHCASNIYKSGGSQTLEAIV